MREFDNYTSKFDMNNGLTKLKYNHSYRVSNLMTYLADKYECDYYDIDLAKTIGLLHDIGRFEQIKSFDTLSDINTMDHADFGEYLLFEKNLIDRFSSNKKDYGVISKAVKYHNKYDFDSSKMTDREKFFINMIRDADKIDIFNIWANLDEIEIYSVGKVSDEVKDDFYSHRMIHNEFKKTEADKVVGTLSYLFDINSSISYQYIKDNNFVDNLYERIDNKEELKDYFDYMNSYINNMLGDNENVRKKIQSFRSRKW